MLSNINILKVKMLSNINISKEVLKILQGGKT